MCQRTVERRRLVQVGVLVFAPATTLDEGPAEVVRVYRERGEVENHIREL